MSEKDKKTEKHVTVPELDSVVESLMRTSFDAVVLQELDGTVIKMNKTTEIISGYSEEELIGGNVFDFEVDGTVRPLEKRFEELEKHGKCNFIVNILTKQGEEKRLDTRVEQIEIEGKSYYLSVARDITEISKASDTMRSQLAKSQDREQELSVYLSCVTAILQHDDFNERAEKVFEIASEYIGAESGFVSLVDEEGLSDGVIALKTGNSACNVDPSLPFRISGLRRQVVKTGEAGYHNDFMNSEWSKGLPEGHQPLDNVLIAPISHENRTVGLLAFSDKEGGFSDNDIDFAYKIAGFLTLALENYRTNREAQKVRDLYRTLFIRSLDGVYIHDLEGNFISANPAAFKMMKFESDNIDGINIRDLLMEEELPKAENAVKEILSKGYSDSVTEYKLTDSQGAERFVETQAVLLGSVDSPEGILGIARDITERKAHLREIEMGRKRLQAIMDNAPFYIMIVDTEDRVLLFNRMVENIFSLSPGEAVGKNLDEIFSEPYLSKYKEENRLIKKTLKPHTFKDKNDKDVTNVIHVETVKFPIFDSDGNLFAIGGIAVDVTEKTRLQEELFKKSKLDSLGVLAGGIAHDFNNILTAVLGNISYLRLTVEDNETIKQSLEEAEKATLRAKDLSSQLLTFARGGAPVKQTTSIRSILEDSARFVLQGSGSKCEFDVPRNLCRVDVDAGQISQVIQNLVLNSAQAMPEGGIIKISAERIELVENNKFNLDDGKYIKLEFVDEGEGIDPEDAKNIFDPYYTTKESGNGLGLAVSYSIIKNHGGVLTLDSSYPFGAKFIILLPCVEDSGEEEMEEEPGLIKGSGRILIMDDDPLIRDIIKRMLGVLGYSCDSALDGKMALEKYTEADENKEPFDLVIMDLTIPGGMGGGEAIKKLLEIAPDAKAIVVSGYSSDEIISNYEEYGFKGVVHKPFKIEELSRVIQTVINGA